MIPIEERGKINRYGFANGFLNIAWLTGWLRRSIPNQEPIPNVVWIQPPSDNLNLCLPVIIKDVDLSDSFKDKSPIHIIARLEEGRIDRKNPTPSVIARALLIDRPSIRNMPDVIGWLSAVPEGAPTDNFRPVGAINGHKLENDNRVHVAGFLVRKFLRRPKEGKHPRLDLLLAQHQDVTKALHIEVWGNGTADLYRKMHPGVPLLIQNGAYYVKSTPDDTAEPVNGIQPVIKHAYIRCTPDQIKPALPHDIRNGWEPWARELYESSRSSAQARASKPPKAEAERQAVTTGAIEDL